MRRESSWTNFPSVCSTRGAIPTEAGWLFVMSPSSSDSPWNIAMAVGASSCRSTGPSSRVRWRSSTCTSSTLCSGPSGVPWRYAGHRLSGSSNMCVPNATLASSSVTSTPLPAGLRTVVSPRSSRTPPSWLDGRVGHGPLHGGCLAFSASTTRSSRGRSLTVRRRAGYEAQTTVPSLWTSMWEHRRRDNRLMDAPGHAEGSVVRTSGI